MAEIALDGAGVVPIVGEREAAAMPQHGEGRGGPAAPITVSCFPNPAVLIGVRRSAANR
jgi:hypothetical protein